MVFRYSSFPQSIDKLKRLPEYQELSAEDKSYVARYTELCQKGANMTTEDKLEFNDLLTNKLRDKMIQSVDWNLMADAITNMQDFYLNHVLKDISDLVNRKESEFNTYIESKSTYFNNYIIDKTMKFNNKLKEFSYKGEYNSNSNYEIWNTVTFKDDTYLCKAPCKNILPTDEVYWSRIARHGEGLKWRGEWSPSINYRTLDVVKVQNQGIFICIIPNYNKIPTSQSSANNLYWDVMYKNTIQPIQYYQNYSKGSVITIEHNLNSMPIFVQAISQYTYGHGGYGMFDLYNNYQLNSLVEYIDKNTIKIHFVEHFNGTPNIKQINTHEFLITHSLEDTEIHVYLSTINNN